MKRALPVLAIALAVFLVGCEHMGESTAPKPDPSRFLPKGGTAGGPPPSTPTSK